MSFFSNLFKGGKNPADAAMPYLQQIPGQTKKYFQPYINAGEEALPQLQQQYGSLLNNPGGMLNNIGQGFQASPGFNFAMQQALQGANHAAAAGGMAGSPQHQQQNMQLATDIGNQEYNHWLQNALGLYGSGLSGQQGLANMGMESGSRMADMIAQTLAQQGNLAFGGQRQLNQNQNDLFGNIFKGAGVLSSRGPFPKPF